MIKQVCDNRLVISITLLYAETIYFMSSKTQQERTSFILLSNSKDIMYGTMKESGFMSAVVFSDPVTTAEESVRSFHKKRFDVT